jgi:hypothetical protein
VKTNFFHKAISRRLFLKGSIAGACFSILSPLFHPTRGAANSGNPIFWITEIPDQPFYGRGNCNYHAGFDSLIHLMGGQGLKFYRSAEETALSGPSGMIEANDVVLIKVNAQWKYRGSTNSDLIRGLIQRILDHPDGFNGEVVIIENGQSQGSLNGDALGWGSYPDQSVHANANDESHSFNWLVNTVFNDPRVSSYLLDPIRTIKPVGAADHTTQGYRVYENVSYPCFTTTGGHRVELVEGIWQGSSYSQSLKLINVPVLKIHDGSEITASLKHFYGVLSMADGVDSGRHYNQLGNTCGKMVVSIRTPVLNIIDAIWVSHGSLSGYPGSTTFRANQILAGQDPVALDYWATKYILYPKTKLPNHLPSYSVIDQWLTQARDIINTRGGLYDPDGGILVDQVTKNEGEMVAHTRSLASNYAHWDNIPGKVASTPALAWNPVANKLQMVARAADDSLWAATFNSNGVFNNDWVSFPGRAASAPALAWNPVANKLQMVVRAADDSLWAATFGSNGAFNNDWVSVPGRTVESPALAWDSLASEFCIIVRSSGDSIWFNTFISSADLNEDWTIISGGKTPSPPGMAYIPFSDYLCVVVRASDDSMWNTLF